MKNINDRKGFLQNNFFLLFKKNILNFKALNKILLVFLISLGIAYIAGSNNLSMQGFTLSELKEQRNKLTDENKKLELKAMTLSSYSIISEKVNNLKMVAVGEIKYINGNNDMVAKK